MRSFALLGAFLIVISLFAGHLPAQPRRTPLGPEVNSPTHDESAPVVSADGTTLYFWSLGREDGYGIQDIYIAEATSNGGWTTARNAGYPLNDAECNIPFSLTPDGTRLLVYREARKYDATDSLIDLALSPRAIGSWGTPSPIKIDGYVNRGSASLSAYLASDGRTLLLSIVGPGSLGQEDLYVCFYDRERRRFSAPLSLGSALNSAGPEVTPFLAADGVTLYFSATRPGGLGGLDLWMTRRLDESWQRWTPPVNLGPTVNSPGDELYLQLPAVGRRAVFASNWQTPTRDLYSVDLPPSVMPRPVLLIKGKVLDQQTQQPIMASIVYQGLPSGRELGIAQTDTSSLEYRLILPAGLTYGFLALAPGYVAISENVSVSLPAGQMYAEQERTLTLARLEVGATIRLNNLFFATGKAELRPESIPELERVVALLRTEPRLSLELAGHTDDIGADTLNISLSERRAKAVQDYLVTQQIEAWRTVVRGYGAREPLAPNTSEADRRRNRRVEIRILSL
jgi:OOP family OmpA-OmpF porin